MSFKKKDYNTIVTQAKRNVLGFESSYSKFIERVSIDQNSKSMITNYSRSIRPKKAVLRLILICYQYVCHTQLIYHCQLSREETIKRLFAFIPFG